MDNDCVLVSTGATDTQHYEQRLNAAADQVDELEVALRDARELRNRIILEAVDNGMSQRPVARAARVAPAQVHRVLASGFAEAS